MIEIEMQEASEEQNAEQKVVESSSQETGRDLSDEIHEVVFMVKNDRAVMRKVTSGIQDNNYIQIVDGVNVGDEVIIAPYNAVSKKLGVNSPVEVVAEEDLFKNDKKK